MGRLLVIAICIIGVSSIVLLTFGCWGCFTEEGHRAYDEMDGMYPALALEAGLAGILLIGICWMVSALRRRRVGLSEGLAFVTYCGIVCALCVAIHRLGQPWPLFISWQFFI